MSPAVSGSAPVSDIRKLPLGDENREGVRVLSDVICGESRDQYDTGHRSSSRCFPCSGSRAGTGAGCGAITVSDTWTSPEEHSQFVSSNQSMMSSLPETAMGQMHGCSNDEMFL